MLVINGPLLFSIFLAVAKKIENHHATPISGHAKRYWGYHNPFQIFQKGLPYWFFEVERHRVMSGFRDCSHFKVNVGCDARLKGENPMVFKCGFGEMLQELFWS